MSQTKQNARRTTEAAADTVRSATDDTTTAVNDGVERMTAGMSQFGTMGQDAMEAMMAAATTFAKGMERIAEENTSFAKTQMEASSGRIQNLSKLRTPQEFMEAQAEMMRETVEATVGQANKVSDMMIQTTREAVQPISKRYSAAVEQMQGR